MFHIRNVANFLLTKYLAFRCGLRIWSRGTQLLRLKVADIVKWPGFWVFNAQIRSLPHSRGSFSLIFCIYFNIKS